MIIKDCYVFCLTLTPFLVTGNVWVKYDSSLYNESLNLIQLLIIVFIKVFIITANIQPTLICPIIFMITDYSILNNILVVIAKNVDSI